MKKSVNMNCFNLTQIKEKKMKGLRKKKMMMMMVTVMMMVTTTT
jgi:hypothetical protein